jgi:mono/diheme cytochrome c family protein
MTRSSLVVCVPLLLLAGNGLAQESGDPKQGQEVARHICGSCHAIGKGTSPAADAPSFDTLAATPGMTQLALTVALRSAHKTMPALVLAPDEHNDVIAYILSLKGGT